MRDVWFNGCGCWACTWKRVREAGQIAMPMCLCASCGNKRCPHGTDHRLECTNSNEPGQAGSRYA